MRSVVGHGRVSCFESFDASPPIRRTPGRRDRRRIACIQTGRFSEQYRVGRQRARRCAEQQARHWDDHRSFRRRFLRGWEATPGQRAVPRGGRFALGKACWHETNYEYGKAVTGLSGLKAIMATTLQEEVCLDAQSGTRRGESRRKRGRQTEGTDLRQSFHVTELRGGGAQGKRVHWNELAIPFFAARLDRFANRDSTTGGAQATHQQTPDIGLPHVGVGSRDQKSSAHDPSPPRPGRQARDNLADRGNRDIDEEVRLFAAQRKRWHPNKGVPEGTENDAQRAHSVAHAMTDP